MKLRRTTCAVVLIVTGSLCASGVADAKSTTRRCGTEYVQTGALEGVDVDIRAYRISCRRARGVVDVIVRFGPRLTGWNCRAARGSRAAQVCRRDRSRITYSIVGHIVE